MRGFLGIATLLGATALPAQTTDNWYSTVEFNPVFSTQSGGEPSFNINYTFNRKVADYVSLGAGVGIEESWKFKGTPMLPVFARVQAEDFSKTFSPFARFDIGYEAGFGDVKGGLMINPTVGVRYGALSLGVGYRGFKSSISGSKFASAVSVNLAYTFGMHGADSEFSRALRKIEFSMGVSALFPCGKGFDEKRTHKVYTQRDEVLVGTQTVGGKLSYNPGGAFSIALTYPVYRNLYLGVSGGISLYSSEDKYFSNMEFEPGGRDLSYGLAGSNYYTYGEFYDFSIDHFMPYESKESDFQVFVAARAKYKFRELTFGGKFFPYAQCDVGYIVHSEDTDKGFYLSPEVGVSLAVGSRHSLDLGIGYTPLRADKYDKSEGFETFGGIYENTYIRPPHGEYSGTKTIGALRISLGYTF